MEYLPDNPNHGIEYHMARKEQKLKGFREYLVNKDIVLAYVKFLLALRNADPRPQNPLQYLQAYFGEYRDPMWDTVDNLKLENDEMAEKLPELEKNIEVLECKIRHNIVTNSIQEVYEQLEKDKTGSSNMRIVNKLLTGNAKFEIGTSFNLEGFTSFLYSIKEIGEDEGYEELEEEAKAALDDNKVEEILEIFKDCLKEGPSFATDLENPIYKLILLKIKEFEPPK